MFRELCGDSTLKNVVLITNMWGDVSEDVGKARENELITNFFKPVLDKGAQIARHYNTVESAHGIIRRILGNRPTTLQIQRELVDKHKDIIDTAAGEAINKELNEQMRRHQAGMRELQEETEKALKKKDEETRQELEEEKRKLQGQMDKIRMESEGMASSYQEEKERMEESVRQVQEKARGMEENMRQTQEEARQEKERANASQKQQMDTLNKQLQDNAKASAAEREAMEQRLNQQHQQDNRPKPKRPIGFFDVALLVVAPGLGIINLMIR